MYLKKCDKVAQENVGTDSLKVFSFISHDSLDQLPVVICSRSNSNRIRCHTACHCYVPNEADSRNANHLSLFKAFSAHLSWVHHSMALCFKGLFFQQYCF